MTKEQLHESLDLQMEEFEQSFRTVLEHLQLLGRSYLNKTELEDTIKLTNIGIRSLDSIYEELFYCDSTKLKRLRV